MSTPIRWGILGAGAVAAEFATGLRFLSDAALVAVGSRDAARAAAFAARFSGAGARVRACASYEELVADPSVDVIYVATPNAQHRAHAELALRAGKPVLVEKPFALDEAEGRAVVELARSRGLFCMEAMWMRCAPAVRAAQEALREGRVGAPRLLTAQLGFPFVVSADHRVFQPQGGGGALLDLGVYPISLAVGLLGAPTSVFARATLGTTGVDEDVSLVLTHPGGAQSVLAASLRTQLGNAALLGGTGGTLELPAPLYFPRELRVTPLTPRGHERAAGPRRLERLRLHPVGRLLARQVGALRSPGRSFDRPGNGYETEAAEVGRCLRAGLRESPLVPLEDSLAVLRVVDAARRQFTAPAAA
jgi:predicted dehydrogenase